MSLSNSHCHTSSDVVRRSDRIVADEHDDSQEREIMKWKFLMNEETS